MTNRRESYKTKVEKCIADVREKYNIRGNFTQADFYRICEAENIELLNGETGRNFYAVKQFYGFLLSFDEQNRNLIYLRSFFNRNRRINMFVAAHELGHYFLNHLGVSAKASNLFELSSAQNEREANYFARLATKKTKPRRLNVSKNFSEAASK